LKLPLLKKPAAQDNTIMQHTKAGQQNISSGCLLRTKKFRIIKTCPFFQKHKGNSPRRAIALFCDDRFGLVFIFFGGLIIFFTKQKNNYVRILFDGAGLTKIRKLRAIAGPLFHRAGKLTYRNHGNPELTRKGLQGTGNLGYFLLTAFHCPDTLH